ncbi:zinc-ribbon domain containing protein [Paludisphaera sp.]|uniref:zinc-ribbon domain containing protein n=1 Tax=Paludisphaera sp. TaxID=2017432 RepID=UPI00301DA1EA
MNHNRKRREAERKRREAEDRERRGVSIEGAAPVDPSAIGPCNSYGPPAFIPRGYYVDIPFTCAACGSEEVWTAERQKWWYEVARGSVFSRASRCRSCRREEREHRGKADPLHQRHHWMLAIREALGPPLLADGWRPVVGEGEKRPDVLSYERRGEVLRFRWGFGTVEGCFLVIERREPGDHRFRGRSRPIYRRRPQEFSPPELRRRLDTFIVDARVELGMDEPKL